MDWNHHAKRRAKQDKKWPEIYDVISGRALFYGGYSGEERFVVLCLLKPVESIGTKHIDQNGTADSAYCSMTGYQRTNLNCSHNLQSLIALIYSLYKSPRTRKKRERSLMLYPDRMPHTIHAEISFLCEWP